METEIWQPIKNYEELYEVSNLGKVRTKIRSKKWGSYYYSPIKGEVHLGRYIRINLTKNKTRKWIFLHVLVCQAFCEGYAEGLQVNHKDGDIKNNNYLNLEWVTATQNIFHKNLILKKGACENHEFAKLKNEDISKIKELYKKGVYNQYELAELYKVNQSQICRILNNKAWTLVNKLIEEDYSPLNPKIKINEVEF